METRKFRNLLFVINPIAGDTNKEELQDSIEAICKTHDITYDIYRTTGENDKEALKARLSENQYDGVFTAGGDGTVSIVASLLIGTTIPLGIIPLGSGNGLSKDMDIPQNTEEALELIHTNIIRNIDTLSINGLPSVHLSGLGFNALVVKGFCESGIRGPGSYARIAMQEYLGYESKSYRIVTDSETFEGKAFMVTIANAKAFGSNASINPEGVLNDGRFEICLIEPFPKAAGIGILYKLYVGSIDTSVYTRRLSCRTATIFNLEHEVMHIDGEPVVAADEIKVEMHAKNLKVILPEYQDEREV